MSWLSKFLGFDDICTNYECHIAWLESTMTSKDEEIQRLTNLILMEHGVIIREPFSGEVPKRAPQAVNRRETFRDVRKRYEEADKKFATDQVNDVKDYWTKKDQIAKQEEVS